MSIDFKALKKLAEVCRKAGIQHFKNADMEFTLTDSIPEKLPRKAHKAAQSSESGSSAVISEDSGLSPEEMLFWSVQDVPKAEGTGT